MVVWLWLTRLVLSWFWMGWLGEAGWDAPGLIASDMVSRTGVCRADSGESEVGNLEIFPKSLNIFRLRQSSWGVAQWVSIRLPDREVPGSNPGAPLGCVFRDS
ncbi:hypothetical protein HNY73_015466 [Argiope bruennichi]|uniref:Secreted protein n=1 Tax=Argiope bruennichi TaxID=94029 RepID=A0A8T0EU40_ARGBR|nr:hypothetical protein HNY73_015466 [Argiope bruennichi]